MKEQLTQNLAEMKKKFIQDLDQIYQKALSDGLLSQALKAKEMLAKCQGYFSNKSEKPNKILNEGLNSNNLKQLLEEIQSELIQTSKSE